MQVLLHWPTTALARWQRSLQDTNGIHKSWRICFPAVTTSRKAEGRVLSMSGNAPEVSWLWLWSDWIDYVVVQHFSRSVTVSFLWFTTNSVLVLFLVLCEVSVHVFVHVCVQAKNSNGTTVRTFSSLAWSLHAPSLSFLSYVIMRSWSKCYWSEFYPTCWQAWVS